MISRPEQDMLKEAAKDADAMAEMVLSQCSRGDMGVFKDKVYPELFMYLFKREVTVKDLAHKGEVMAEQMRKQLQAQAAVQDAGGKGDEHPRPQTQS